ncbi:MAG: hypothetical protein ACE145_20880 [Terriglobia bacterium]
MAIQFHLSLDVIHFLKTAKRADYRGMLKSKDGEPLSEDDAKEALLQELAKGKRFIPIGICDHFDPERGCLGHPEKSETEIQR